MDELGNRTEFYLCSGATWENEPLFMPHHEASQAAKIARNTRVVGDAGLSTSASGPTKGVVVSTEAASMDYLVDSRALVLDFDLR